MGRLFFTGDKHGSVEMNRLSFKHFPLGRELTKEDIVCICGDVGLVWDGSNTDKYWQDWCEDLPFTVIGCLGNHENYDLIRQIPAEEWNGGLVRKVRPHVMYLENGELFNIFGRIIFVQGGASSIDKARRVEGKSWWSAEIPNRDEFEHAAETLERANFNVDIVISHTAPNFMINKIDRFSPQYDDVTNFLNKFVYKNTTINIAGFCGHFHIDRSFPDHKFHFLYDDIIEILSDNTIRIVNN